MESKSKISWKTREPYDESLNPFAEPRTSVAFSEELRNKLKQMGFGGDTSKPVGIEFDDIVAASFRIRKGVGKTPCEVNLIKYSNINFYLYILRSIITFFKNAFVSKVNRARADFSNQVRLCESALFNNS